MSLDAFLWSQIPEALGLSQITLVERHDGDFEVEPAQSDEPPHVVEARGRPS